MKNTINSFDNTTSVLIKLVLIFSLAAYGRSNNASDTVNAVPTTNAGRGQTIFINETVTLMGKLSGDVDDN
ncbi:MAG: hypothetical protein QMC62_00405 [Alteromonadaceae bacterium]|jgi:hypothetical protein